MTALQRPARGLELVDGIRRTLAAARTVDGLLAAAAAQAREVGGYGRALVLDVADGRLSAEITAELGHEASDALRRRALAAPIAIGGDSLEADLARGAAPGRSAYSVIERALDLEDAVIVPVTPENVPVALLVADAPGPRPEGEGLLAVIAHFAALQLTALVLRTRVDELSTEIRYLTASAHALLHEAQHAPISLPRDHGQGLAFAQIGMIQGRRRQDDGLLTPREREIMEQVVAGRSNSEIAAELHLSADTVKTHVGRLLRKLGATNRVGAVVAYLERTREDAP